MKNILYVDDDITFAQELCEVLLDFRHQVTRVKDEGTALQIFCQNIRHFDLVITTSRLKQMRVESFIAYMRAARLALPVLVLVEKEGYTSIEVLGLNATEMLHKPFSARSLLEAISKIDCM